MIAENTARQSIEGGRYSRASFYDIINSPKKDKRTGRQIVDDLAQKMGIEVIKNGSI